MNNIFFKPMLAASLVKPTDTEETLMANLKDLHFPILATPKLDGIRCLTTVGFTVGEPDFLSKPVCRSLKPVPNDYIRDTVSTLPPGLDGEICTYSERDLLDGECRPRNFHEIQSDVMSYMGRPTFKFHVFDCNIEGGRSYCDRVKVLEQEQLPDWCVKVLPTTCRSIEELQAFMSLSIQQGHEGICFRSSMYCPYKYGRSTLRQQWLVKWKLFETSEATIVGFEEEMHNANEAEVGLLGQLERSSHLGGMQPKGRLGAFHCNMNKDDPFSLEGRFKIGTGFTAEMRREFWERRDSLLGQVVTFKHQPYGAKDAPRIPVFVGIRSKLDM